MRTPVIRRSSSSLSLLCLLLGGSSVLPAFGQDARLHIDHLEKLADKAAEVVDVTLDAPMLQLAAKFMSGKRSLEEARAREVVRDLKGIYVKSFEFDKEGEYSEADVEAIRTQLRTPAWSRIVGVRSKRNGENTEVYLRTQGDNNIVGLAVIAAEAKELTVVNIVGPIDVDKLSELEGHLGVPHLGLERRGKREKEAGHEDAK